MSVNLFNPETKTDRRLHFVLATIVLCASGLFLSALFSPTSAASAQLTSWSPLSTVFSTSPSLLSTEAKLTTQRYHWPCPPGPVTVTRGFSPPAQPWLSGHRGVDLACSVGTVIRAAAEGQVHFVGTINGVTSVSVLHSDGIRTTYQPVEPLVQKGQKITAGSPIGKLQAGHEANALHFGAKYDDRHYINPLFLILGPIRLFP